ncbi:putative sporulation protein YtxC [Bacillaceae bacterium]
MGKMKSVRILVPPDEDEVNIFREILRCELERLKESDWCVEWEDTVKREGALFTCRARPANPSANGRSDSSRKEVQFLHHLSLTVADYVLRCREKKIVHWILVKEFYYGMPEEIARIGRHVDRILKGETDHPQRSDRPEHGREARRRKIYEKVRECLREDAVLNVEGFIRFRLKDYWEELRTVVEYSIDEYLMEKEYQEFIQLLRYFVSLQEPRLPLLHVVHKEDRHFLLFHRDFTSLHPGELEPIMKELRDQEINYEDLIVSALITLAPKKIVLHTREAMHNVIYTLVQIFQEKVTLCTSCSFCKGILEENKLFERP